MVRTFAYMADGQNINKSRSRFQTVLASVLATAVFLTLSSPAVAAGNMACAERVAILRDLGTKYSEGTSAVGIANNGGLIELLTSDNGKTWTIIVSMPDGTSCLLAAGADWTPVHRVVQGPSL